MVTVWEDDLCKTFPPQDPGDFEAIIEQYQAFVFAIILRFVNNRDDVQDIAQDVFLQVYRSLPACQPDHLKAWIGKIATNKAIDWKRQQGRRPRVIETYGPDYLELEERPGPDPEELIMQKEKDEYLREICLALPPRYGRVLIKYHFQEKSYQQIAREEGISLKTVESRLYRGRKLLRQRWEAKGQ